MTNDIDNQIRQALANDPDAPLLKSMDEPGIFEQFRSTFRGRNRWMMWLVFCWTFVFFIIAVVSAVRFFQVEALDIKIAYVAAFFYCMMAVGMLKMWHWAQMDKFVILREIKRLELQVAYLSSKGIEKPDA